MQILYQLDLRADEDMDRLREGFLADSESPELTQAAWALASAAWADHAQADAIVAEFAPDWPTPRQPPVDRAILRLAFHEMVSGHAPPSVAIDEALELAHAFCAEESPPFINGILDAIRKRLEAEGRLPAESKTRDKAGGSAGGSAGSRGGSAQDWLDDAVREANT